MYPFFSTQAVEHQNSQSDQYGYCDAKTAGTKLTGECYTLHTNML